MTGLEMRELRFTVPGQPLPWQRARRKGKQHFNSPEQVAYKDRIRWAALQAGARLRPPHSGRASVEALVVVASKRRSDLDNFAKQLGDAGNGLLWEDDSQIDEWLIRRRVDRENPRVEVVVRMLPEAVT